MHHRDPRDQTPIVLLHSLGTDAELWHHQVQPFSALGPTLTPQTRGHGGRPWPGSTSVEEWVSDLYDVVAGRGRVHLVGLSMGGMQAIAFAARHPELVRSLVVANAFAHLPPHLAQQRVDGAVSAIETDGIAAYADTYLAQTLTTELDGEDYRRLHDAIAGMSPQAYLASAQATFRADVRPMLSQIACPTLVLTGSNDRKTPLSAAEAIAGGIQDARVGVVEGAGHLSCIENSDGFDREVTAFIERTSSAHPVAELGRGL